MTVDKHEQLLQRCLELVGCRTSTRSRIDFSQQGSTICFSYCISWRSWRISRPLKPWFSIFTSQFRHLLRPFASCCSSGPGINGSNSDFPTSLQWEELPSVRSQHRGNLHIVSFAHIKTSEWSIAGLAWHYLGFPYVSSFFGFPLEDWKGRSEGVCAWEMPADSWKPADVVILPRTRCQSVARSMTKCVCNYPPLCICCWISWRSL